MNVEQDLGWPHVRSVLYNCLCCVRCVRCVRGVRGVFCLCCLDSQSESRVCASRVRVDPNSYDHNPQLSLAEYTAIIPRRTEAGRETLLRTAAQTVCSSHGYVIKPQRQPGGNDEPMASTTAGRLKQQMLRSYCQAATGMRFRGGFEEVSRRVRGGFEEVSRRFRSD